MRNRIAGIPLWLFLLVGGGTAAFYVYKKRAATQAAAAQAASAAQPTQSAAASAGPSGDPLLLAYQSGEASGVASYSAGVTTGISLVDSIMQLFPGGATEATQAASQATAPQPATITAPQVSNNPSGAGYTHIPNWATASMYQSEGIPIYVGEPVGNGQIEFTPAPKGLTGLASGTPLYTYTGIGTGSSQAAA